MKGRILFTGNGNLVIDDLMKHIPEGYQLDKCPPAEPNFRDALVKFRPHAVVACLANETRETLRMYASLEEYPQYSGMPIFAIGNGEDCSIFKGNIFQKNMQIFVRPLDRDSFIEKLNECLAAEIQEAIQAEEQDTGAAAEKAAEERALAAAVEAETALIVKIEKMTHIHGRKTILTVDDDVTMLNVIKVYLQDLYDIVLVPSGKLALKYLSKKPADLVLLDYMMPGEDGPSVLRQIRESSPHPDIPVLFLTGIADKSMVLRGLEFRPNGYLLKPVKRQILLEKVTEILLGLQ